jgi:homospermidine synthase
LLVKELKVTPERIKVIDFVDNRGLIQDLIRDGLVYEHARITPENYPEKLSSWLSAGDVLVDLGWNIETKTMLQWCRDNNVLYVNTSVEVWDPYADSLRSDPREYTLYRRQMELRGLVQQWGSNTGSTAVLDHGANPGLVSHFTKRALLDIGARILANDIPAQRRKQLQQALDSRDFPKLASLSGTKVIHISERDTQISDQPKRVDEFVNTWSVEGLFEEGIAPAEMGWGTHEVTMPEDGVAFEDGPRNAICLRSLGVNTWARSWVPSGPIIGMVIRHGEAFGISDRLTVWEGNRATYRPTVHYVYCPSDAAIASVHELRMREYRLQEQQRIMTNEITSGWDELGVLVMGHDLNAWWTGTVLDIDEARQLAPNQNATTLQVACSVVAAVRWMIQNPRRGICLPDDVDHEEILKVATPYLGRVVSEQVTWTPACPTARALTSFGEPALKEESLWQFSSFRV